MTLLRRGSASMVLILGLVLGGATGGCTGGAPERASDIQNLNAISDDIAAVNMTLSPTARAQDPNRPTTFPRAFQTSYSP